MSEFHFLRPLWLLALVPAIALAFACLGRDLRRAGSWGQLIDPALLGALLAPVTARSSRLPLALLLAGWCGAVLAIAGPAWERLPEPVHRRADALVIALDLSLSMYASDVTPSRVERARYKLQDLLNTRHDGYTALVVYAGDAHTVTPLSDDAATLGAMLGALDPSIMPEQGSNPEAAVKLAGELVHSAGLERGRVLLVSDALTAEQAAPIGTLLREQGLVLSVLAVGTASGAPVPLPGGGFARDAGGSIVVPGVDTRAMREAATMAGARFATLTLDDADLQSLLPARVDDARAEEERSTRRFDQWLDRAPWLACALLPLAALAFRRGWLFAIALCVLLPQPRAHALEWDDLWLTRDQQGQRAREAKDPARAAQLFRSPGWRGTAAYEAGDFPAAAEAFGADKGADAAYNRGNALARAGRLEDALGAYDSALAAEPGMSDASENRRLVEELLRQQKQQQQQQRQQQQQSGAGQDEQPQPGDQQQQSQQAGDGEQQRQPGDSQQDGSSDEEQRDQDTNEQQQQQQAQSRQDESKRDGAKAPDDQLASGEESQADKPRSAEPAESQAEAERRQALEQWLRQVPDDPGALLRRKFEYEARVRAAARGERGS